jgi:hypothetical protein
MAFAVSGAERELYIPGDLSWLEREGRERRRSLLGDLVLVFRYTLMASVGIGGLRSCVDITTWRAIAI